MGRCSGSFVFSVIAVLLLAQSAVGQQRFEPAALALNQLEKMLAEIDTELEQLAAYNFRSGIGSVGYQSKTHKQPLAKEWIRIELGRELPVDQIVLVPTIGGDSKKGFQAKAFPVNFRILAGSGQTTNVVAAFTEEDGLLPRIAPLVVSCDSINASWVGVEATKLSLRGVGIGYGLELSEVMVFSGLDNVALGRPVSVSSSKQVFKARNERFLTDGFVPYMMDSANGTGSSSVGFRSRERFSKATLIIDLQKPCPINQINLHAIDTYRTVPETAPSDSATPPRLRVTGANRPDFAAPVPLLEFRHESVYHSGPIRMQRFPEKTCRYVRLELLEFQRGIYTFDRRFLAGFSEIEVLSKGRNVALGKPVIGENLPNQGGDLALLTDGNNYFGKILPMRTWMKQLAKRHDLEAERPEVATELTLRYARQTRNLNIMYWLAALLSAGTIIVVLLERNIRQRAAFKSRMQQQLEAKRIRTSISRDLHDDVGSTIGALSMGLELLKSNLAGDADRASVQDLQQVCREATVALRESISMTRKETVTLHDFVNSMRERVLFILGPDRIEFTQDNGMVDRRISLSMERNMMLIFKEILHNHQKHSRADKLYIRVGTIQTKAFFIEARDQGVGFDMDRKEEGHWGMETMEERAKEIGAELEIQSAAGEGTTVRLIVPAESFDRKDTLK